LLALILALGAVLRIAHLAGLWGTLALKVPIIDSAYYHARALDLLAGKGGEEGIFFMSPLYPYVLALFYKLFGPFPQTAALFQMLGGVALIYMVYLLGRRLFSEPVGLLAALLAALYRPFVFYEGAVLSAVLILLLNTGALLLLTAPPHRPRRDLLAGLLLGLSALARPTALLFAGALAAGFLFLPALGKRARAAWLLLGVVLVLLPVAGRNYRSGGEWVLTTAGLGMNFYVGNNPEAQGDYWEAPFIRSAEPQYENSDYRLEASRRTGRELGVAQASRFWLGQGLAYIVSRPLDYLELLARKFFLFFHDTEIPNNLSLYAAQIYSPFLRYLPLTFGLVAPLALAFGLLRRRRMAIPPLVTIYFCSYLAATLLFFASSEYRLPVMPVLLILAAAGLVELWHTAKAPPRVRFALLLVLAAGLALPLNMPTSFTTTRANPRMDFFNLGSTLLKQGRHEEAVVPLQRALIIDPAFVDAHIALGDCYSSLGLRQEAIVEFERAGLDAQREIRLLDAERTFNEAQAKAQQGDIPEALKIYRQGLELNPEAPAYVFFNMAYLSLLTADTTRAMEYLDEAGTADPQEERVPFLRGLIHENRSEWFPALELFLQSLRLNGNFHLARAHAALMHLNLGDRGEAGKLIEPLVGQRFQDADLAALVEDIADRVGF